MKKVNYILICIIIALISGIIGFIIGITMRENIVTSSNTIQSEEDTIVGTYKTNTWNGHEAVLVLNSDKSMIYPDGGTGIWALKDEKIYLKFKSNIGMLSEYLENKVEEKYSIKEAIIVDKGIMIDTHFFEKVK